MARTFAKSPIAPWNRPAWFNLSKDAKVLLQVLQAHPTVSLSGVGDWRLPRIAALIQGDTVHDIARDATELTEAGFILVDADSEEFLLRQHIENQNLLPNSKLTVALIGAISEIASREIRTQLLRDLVALHRDNPDLRCWKLLQLLLAEGRRAEEGASERAPHATWDDAPDDPSETYVDGPSEGPSAAPSVIDLDRTSEGTPEDTSEGTSDARPPEIGDWRSRDGAQTSSVALAREVAANDDTGALVPRTAHVGHPPWSGHRPTPPQHIGAPPDFRTEVERLRPHAMAGGPR